ncbi:Bug family tripartite tricarboxylate transporter substrate binding protein [Piscinibacter sakaiensis]|uniref:Bug family tripartite tricarboxylate transporter substrate binding protein n=1 Tax=Piscinibacter sakaiensis TaxID=1547922 RepID=UPI003AACF9D3
MTLVVPYPPGGATDVIGRILANAMGARLGQQVLVENRAGAGTAIGAGQVAQSAPDGYTLLISSNTTFTINPALKAKLPYDPLTSFESIGVMGTSPLVLLAHPSVPAKNLKELVALAKAKPGQLNFGSFGNGTTAHFAGELLKVMADINIVHVPYKGSAPAMQDLIGGQIQLTFDTNVAAIPQVNGGKVKAIAVTSLKPSPTMPGVPSIAQSGYEGYEMVPWITVVAPRGLPAPVRTALTKAFADSLADADTRTQLTARGVDVQPEPPAAYERRVAEELPKLRAYVHKAGLSEQ